MKTDKDSCYVVTSFRGKGTDGPYLAISAEWRKAALPMLAKRNAGATIILWLPARG